VHNQHSNNGAQSIDGFVPKNNEKNGEKWGLWEKIGFRILGKKWKNGGKWWQMDYRWRLYDGAVMVGWRWEGVWVVGFGY
jgi:hypothetical protein